MKIPKSILFVTILTVAQLGHTQGFLNLDFESANVSGQPPGSVPANKGIPGWTAYIGSAPQSTILYNNASLGEAAVSLQGTNGIYPSLQAQFSVLLQSTFFAPDTNTAAIGQTGTVPASARSLVFWANTALSGVANSMQVTFNGGVLPYFAIGSGSGYTIYGADISSLSGETGPLVFTAFNNTYAEIDNIQFSVNPIPEPGPCALILSGAALFGVNRWRKRYASSKLKV